MTDWSTWKPNLLATLLFLVKDGRVLLIRKKRGLGAGKINGPGGKIDPGETPEQCAVRETQEELGVTVSGITEAGRLAFQFVDGLALYVYVYRGSDCQGDPVETDEAIPQWTDIDKIPFHEMWADDEYWFHHLLSGQPFVGAFDFDGDTMLSCQMNTAAACPPEGQWV